MWTSRRFLPIRLLHPGATEVELVRDVLGASDGPLYVRKTARAFDGRHALRREVSRLHDLRHDALRNVVAFEEDPRRCVAVFEHVDGRKLSQHLREHGDKEEVLACVRDILRALVYLHGRSVVHGDLKPENVIVPRKGGVALIDLGLSADFGGKVGGTQGFIAPEYERGAPASIAGEMYAFGALLRDVRGESATVPKVVRELERACLDSDPAKRPASASAALAMIEQFPRPLDSRGGPPFLCSGMEEIRQVLSRFDGTTMVVEAPQGAGRSRLIEELRRWALGKGTPKWTDATLAAGHNPLFALSSLLSAVPKKAGAEHATIDGVVAAARHGIALSLDDCDGASPLVSTCLPYAAAALRRLGRGAWVLVGPEPELAKKLRDAGATTTRLDPLTAEQIEEVALLTGLRADRARLDALAERTKGLAGRVVTTALAIAERPNMTPEQIRALGSTTKASPKSGPTGDEDPPARQALALAEAAQGKLSHAVELLEGIDLSPEVAVEKARWLERLGQYEACRAEAELLMGSSSAPVRGEAAIMAAAAAYAMGDLEGAQRSARHGLELPQLAPERSAHLWAILSDVAIARGQAEAALRHASDACDAAQGSGEPLLLPIVLSRVAAAHALGGAPKKARAFFREALDAAEKGGDIVSLPPYIMNLATAEHALSSLGSALSLYAEAARLAKQLGRHSTYVATQLNLGGLLTTIGAEEEATAVLSEAKAEPWPVYAAQAKLLRAELLAETDPAGARRAALAAQQSFDELASHRQALETGLFLAELDVAAGQAEGALSFCSKRRAELDQGGLQPRALLVEADAYLLGERFDQAMDCAEEAVALCEVSGDRDLTAKSLYCLAQVHRAVESGAEESILSRSRELVASIAARLPSGLRERYLCHGFRGALRSTGTKEEVTSELLLVERSERVLSFVRRVLLEDNEKRLLESAVDEALAITKAERAFLLRARKRGKALVEVARNMDQDTLRGRSSRFSTSIANRVLSSGEPIRTARADHDPHLPAAESIVDLRLRSVLCVPVRGPSAIVGALYVDHRFQSDQFGANDQRLLQSMADIIGVALEKARLHRELVDRSQELERANAHIRREHQIQSAEVDRLTSALARLGPTPPDDQGGMIGASHALARALDMARRVAPSVLPILVQGESGTGKELLARYIHERSPRHGAPFVAVNCGALPETLLESELFGHVKGAFTGAIEDRSGLIRAASGGTLFLDEIGEMALGMQTRLLRVLQEGELRPLGGSETIDVDVRVIAATNRDLESEVEAERFRKDLFFRLCGLSIHIPPLRERLEDLPDLVVGLLKRIAKEPGMSERKLSQSAFHAMMQHSWPGNIRELQQVLRRSVLTSQHEEIRAEELGLPKEGPHPRKLALQRFDREIVRQALEAHGGNRTLAARSLGVSRATIYRWISRYHL